MKIDGQCHRLQIAPIPLRRASARQPPTRKSPLMTMTTQQFVLSFIVLNAVIAIAHYRAEPLRTSILRLAIQIDSIGKAAFVEPAIRAIHLLAGRGGIFMRSRYHALYPFLWCATSALATLSVSHYFFDSEPLKSEVATARTNLLSQTIYRLSKDEYEIYARMSIQEFENVYRYYMMLCVQAKVHFSNAAYFVGMSMYALYLVWILRGATSSRLVRSERDVFGSLLMLLVGALLFFWVHLRSPGMGSHQGCWGQVS